MKHGIALLLICTILFSACAATNPKTTAPAAPKPKPANIKEWVLQQNRAQRNAMIGAAAGAVLALVGGGSRDDMLKRALAGAVVGAMAGYAIGKHQDRVFAQRDFAVQQAHYDSSQGYVASVQAVSLDPPQLKPGAAATLYVRYLVIGPDPNESIKISLFRGFKYSGDYVLGFGPYDFVVPRGGGIVESTMEITLPAKASEGTYDVEAVVNDGKQRFSDVVGTSTMSIVAANRARKLFDVAGR